MTYESFKEMVIRRLSEDIPEPKKISVQSICRNNDNFTEGIYILENGGNIAPTLYIGYYYDYYQSGHSFQSTYEMILKKYKENKTTENIDVSFFTDFSQMKSTLMLKLVHSGKNRKLLQDTPHIPFLDLAIVFCCRIPVDPEIGNASILIRNSHLHLWDQTAESLYPIARTNSERILPPKLHNMNSMISNMLTSKHVPSVVNPEDPLYPLYVLTNDQNLYGASCILYEGLLRSLADRFCTDLYILPSSIHEVILVPASSDSRLRKFSDMVREVNEAHVAEEEVLSDHAYYYSRERDRILY